ncbi:MAG: hypothetical protein M1546_15920, partial [Chloroflexi bacterium]|nr:hypothetical protein [Chloroflexota bacterium]
ALSQFLCCGHTAGGTRIWGISYPRSWRVDLIPNDPDGFLAAMFSSPRGDMKIVIAPSAWTPIGTVMDTGDVDQYLNGLAATRRQQHAGFTEFLRQPVPGFPNSRVWSGNWPEDHRRMWESYLAMVTPMPYVEGMPRGALMLMGLYAESSQWATARAIYERMLGTLQVQVISTGAAYMPPKPGPSNDPEERSVGESGSSATHFWELVFCPKACEWQYIDVANQPAGGVWTCTDGCVGQLSEVACTPDRCY